MRFVSWFQSIVIRFHCFEDFGKGGKRWKKDTDLVEARKQRAGSRGEMLNIETTSSGVARQSRS